ncbi:MAG TPA: peptidase M28, partial [Gammaproteobacteria bacterium]
MSLIERIALVLIAAASIAACERDSGTASSPAQLGGRITPEMDLAGQAITAVRIRDVVAELSDDRYGGRLPGTQGDTLARRYLAAELSRLGFAPGGADGGFEQPVELVGVTAQAPPVWRFDRGGSAVELARSTDFVVGSGVQAETAEVRNAELVFAGYAIQAPEYDWDDFKDVDVRGKVLVVLNNDPDWDPALFEGTTRLYYGRWSYKYESAARQ